MAVAAKAQVALNILQTQTPFLPGFPQSPLVQSLKTRPCMARVNRAKEVPQKAKARKSTKAAAFALRAPQHLATVVEMMIRREKTDYRYAKTISFRNSDLSSIA